MLLREIAALVGCKDDRRTAQFALAPCLSLISSLALSLLGCCFEMVAAVVPWVLTCRLLMFVLSLSAAFDHPSEALAVDLVHRRQLWPALSSPASRLAFAFSTLLVRVS